MTGGDQELSAGIFDLFCLDPSIEGALLDIRRSPSAASCSTAEIVSPVRIHVNIILATLLHYPAGFLIIAVTEHPFALAPVVAWIMIGRQLMVDRFVEFDAPFFDILF